MILDVVEGGLLTTVQDAGRREWTHLGVPEAGPADPWSFAVANLLIGNEEAAAALEITVGGPTMTAREGGRIALTGADLGAYIVAGSRLPPGRTHSIPTGATIAFDGQATARAGARAYLALAGGVDVPVILGSRATCLAGGFGGLDGRPLAAGDTLASLRRESGAYGEIHAERAWPATEGATRASRGDVGRVLRVLPGPDPGLADLVAGPWRVAPAMDRVGVRLDGPDLSDSIGGETLTHGVPWGAIQVPPGGRPIVLGPDHQTTGGYRVVGVVIAADRPVLGQLRPGDPVELRSTDLAAADIARHAAVAALTAGARALHDAAEWERLAASAGADR